VKRKARELSEKLRMEEKELIEEAIDKLQKICFKKTKYRFCFIGNSNIYGLFLV
jgi:hypothetical protein